MKKSEVIIPLLISAAIVLLLVKTGLLEPATGLTTLASIYLNQIPDPSSLFTSYSYEVVTSVLWDQRGYDTYFETSVLFLAIVGSLLLMAREADKRAENINSTTTVIVKLVTRILAALIVVISFSVAIHGHVSPGGGFQGGAVFAVAPVAIMLAYTSRELEKHGFRGERLIAIRILAVTAISIIGLLPVFYTLSSGLRAYLFQNLSKQGSLFSYPSSVTIGGYEILLSGTLIFLNISEFLAVAAGFSIALYLLTKNFEEVRGE